MRLIFAFRARRFGCQPKCYMFFRYFLLQNNRNVFARGFGFYAVFATRARQKMTISWARSFHRIYSFTLFPRAYFQIELILTCWYVNYKLWNSALSLWSPGAREVLCACFNALTLFLERKLDRLELLSLWLLMDPCVCGEVCSQFATHTVTDIQILGSVAEPWII